MAQGDENLAFQSIQNAKAKGLDVEAIGGHWVNKDGVMKVALMDFNYDLDKFREFVSSQMKIDAQQGDTLIVFTIGHGMPSGELQNLGQRADVLKAIAQAAEENNQKTIWWQLSCYASSRLPSLSTLSESQQELLSIMASSYANQESPAYVEGKIMGRIFTALAEKSKAIDPNSDDQVTLSEFKSFLGASDIRRSDLFFSNSDRPIFGGTDLANQIPIVDRNNPQGKYPPGYIPLPKKQSK